ncbi:MAG TPA: amidohydrolase [Vicinamibacteria bacterium]|nr:amidohydrolase [Vicinamibacteria bacterium]
MPGGRLPTREDLDRVVSDLPVYLAAYDGHTGWANSAALALAKVDAQTTFPGWGVIVRDGRGEATGVFKEQAQTLVTAVIPKVSHDEQRAALRRGVVRANALGITSIQNAHGTPEEVELFREAAEAGELTLRVGVAQTLRPPLPPQRIDEVRALADRYANGLVRVKAVKIVVDGVIEAHTAAMLAPYTDEASTSGLPAWTQDALDDVVARADRAGLQVYIHAIGDAGVRMALDTYERARRANGRSDSRFRVEHLETIDMADVPRFASLGVLASMMPIHADPDSNGAWIDAIGPARSSRGFAWRLMEKAGARLMFSSDWPSTLTLDPWRGLHCAVNRTNDDGRPVTRARDLRRERATRLHERSRVCRVRGVDQGHVGGGQGGRPRGVERRPAVTPRELAELKDRGLVRPAGFEPATYRFVVSGSLNQVNNLSTDEAPGVAPGVHPKGSCWRSGVTNRPSPLLNA